MKHNTHKLNLTHTQTISFTHARTQTHTAHARPCKHLPPLTHIQRTSRALNEHAASTPAPTHTKQNKTTSHYLCMLVCPRARTHTPHAPLPGLQAPLTPHRPHPPTRKHSHTGRGRRRLRGGGRPRMLLWVCVLSVYALHCCAWPVWPPMRGSGRPRHVMSNGPNAPFVACQAA